MGPRPMLVLDGEGYALDAVYVHTPSEHTLNGMLPFFSSSSLALLVQSTNTDAEGAGRHACRRRAAAHAAKAGAGGRYSVYLLG